MRLKHNKKRNTAFLFEVLTREYVKSIVRNNNNRQTTIKKIIKEHFCTGPLKDELMIYRELMESSNLSEKEATGVLAEAKGRYDSLNRREVFSSQNRLIKEMNHTLSQSVFSNFVPNYKTVATVYNIFNNKTSIKEKMILEKRVIESLTTASTDDSKSHLDNLTYKTFVEKFNNKYSELPEEQKGLLTNYIASFSDNNLSLKSYLNDQVSELKIKMLEIRESNPSISEEGEMRDKFDSIVEKLDGYSDKEVDDTMVSEVLHVQQLVREMLDA